MLGMYVSEAVWHTATHTHHDSRYTNVVTLLQIQTFISRYQKIIIIITIVISLKQSLPNAYAWFKNTKIQETIQHGL